MIVCLVLTIGDEKLENIERDLTNAILGLMTFVSSSPGMRLVDRSSSSLAPSGLQHRMNVEGAKLRVSTTISSSVIDNPSSRD